MNIAKLNSRNRRAGKKNGHLALPPEPAPPLKLDLGCGIRRREGFTGVDFISFPGVDIVADLRQKWPWDNDSVDEVHCSHFLEHLERMERCHFLNELYRVLKPGAKATIITPHWASCRAYGDPTHKWPPVSEFLWYYVSRDWRLANVPHTDAKHLPGGFDCNFHAQWAPCIDAVTQTKNQEYQQHAIAYFKEAILDLMTTLTKC